MVGAARGQRFVAIGWIQPCRGHGASWGRRRRILVLALVSPRGKRKGTGSQSFRRRERQPPLPFVELLQPLILRTALATDHSRCNKVPHFPAKPSTFQPIFPTD